MPRKKKYKYEDKVEIIDAELQKRKHKWHLNALAWFDFEDVEQIIKLELGGHLVLLVSTLDCLVLVRISHGL